MKALLERNMKKFVSLILVAVMAAGSFPVASYASDISVIYPNTSRGKYSFSAYSSNNSQVEDTFNYSDAYFWKSAYADNVNLALLSVQAASSRCGQRDTAEAPV